MAQWEDPTLWIEASVREFIDQSPENTLKNQDNDKAFETGCRMRISIRLCDR